MKEAHLNQAADFQVATSPKRLVAMLRKMWMYMDQSGRKLLVREIAEGIGRHEVTVWRYLQFGREVLGIFECDPHKESYIRWWLTNKNTDEILLVSPRDYEKAGWREAERMSSDLLERPMESESRPEENGDTRGIYGANVTSVEFVRRAIGKDLARLANEKRVLTSVMVEEHTEHDWPANTALEYLKAAAEDGYLKMDPNGRPYKFYPLKKAAPGNLRFPPVLSVDSESSYLTFTKVDLRTKMIMRSICELEDRLKDMGHVIRMAVDVLLDALPEQEKNAVLGNAKELLHEARRKRKWQAMYDGEDE